MDIKVNGKKMSVKEIITIEELLRQLSIEDKVMAVAVNMNVVKKEQWHTRTLESGDKVEFLQFVGGG